MRRLALIVAALLGLATVALGQPITDETIQKLLQIAARDAGEWKFKHPAEPGGERPDLDDADWQTVRPEHVWDHPNSEAWYRKRVVIPETVGGVPVAGSRVVLRCAVDDDMEIFVGGESRGKFHWDKGEVIITDNAKPGDEFLIAIRAINGPVHGRLMSASLTYDRFADMREAADLQRMRLEFCKRLLGVKRLAGQREQYAATLEQAAGSIDFDAVARRDRKAFEASLAESLEVLEPFSKLAKQYTIYLVGHAHIDMNWLWLWPETKEVCRLTWRQALKFMDEFPEFRFTQSQPGCYIAIEEENPELFRRMQEAAKRGQWEVAGASWVEGDTNMASGESLARQCLLADRYFAEKFDRRSETVWLPDNFGHAWTLPSIFADAGYKYFYFCRAGKRVPTFWWEAPDGGRLLAYNHRWYNEQFRAERGVVPLDIEDAVGVPACMIVYGVGDHGGGPTRIDIETAKRLQNEPIFPRIEFAESPDYFEAALKHSGGDLPVVRDELNFTFEGCYTTHGDVKLWNREGENILPTAETIAAIAQNWGASYPADGFTQGWRNVCFNQFHDILPGSAIHDSYKFSKGLHEQTMRIANGAIDEGLQRLCAAIDTRGAGQAIVVWNPVAWERREYVEARIATSQEWRAASVTNSAGKAITAQIIANVEQDEGFETTVAFVADLPATGYEVFHIAPAEAGRKTELTLAPDTIDLVGEHCAAILDSRHGTLAGLVLAGGRRDKLVMGNYAAVEGRSGACLQVLHEAPRGMSAWSIGRIMDTAGLLAPEEVKAIDSGPVRQTVYVKHRFRKSTIEQVVTLYADLPRVDFNLTADWQELGNDTDGSPFLKAAFPLQIEHPLATFEIPWGSIERPCNGHEVPAQKWIDLAETERIIPEGGREAKAIDLRSHFNEDVIATLANPTDGDFDADNCAYSEEIFAESPGEMLSADGVPFHKPPIADGASNAIRAVGQTIEWPPEKCPALAVLGASSNGRHGGTARLLYADGSEENAPLEFSDWCFGPGNREVQAFAQDYRLDRGRRSPLAIHLWMRRLQTDPDKPLRGIILPDQPNLHIFGLAFAEKVEHKTLWGVSLLNDCKYGFDVEGNVMRISLLRASYNPDPTPDQGVHHIRYALYPHQGDWRKAETPRRAFEFNNPPIVRAVDGHAGTLPPTRSFLSVEPSSMILSALKRAEDGNGYIARVYNSCGVGGTARITCSLPFDGAVACNLLEDPREDNCASVEGPVVTLDLQGRLHGTVRLTQ